VNPVKPNQQVYTRQDPYYPDGLIEPQPYYNAGYQGQPYPGLTPYNNYNPAAFEAPSTALAAPSTSTGLPFNFSQMKGIIDRMGGIDGLMGHVTRIQKIIQSIQQLSPMLKLLMGSKARTAGQGDVDGLTRPARRGRSSPTRRSGKKTYKRRSR
jgi:hypothetical protein